MADAIALALTDVQEAVGHVAETDSQGNAVDVAGISVTSSDESVVTGSTDGSGTVTVSSVGPTGTATVSINDADDNLTQEVNVAVGTSNPTALAVTFDDPTDRTAAPVEPPVEPPA